MEILERVKEKRIMPSLEKCLDKSENAETQEERERHQTIVKKLYSVNKDIFKQKYIKKHNNEIEEYMAATYSKVFKNIKSTAALYMTLKLDHITKKIEKYEDDKKHLDESSEKKLNTVTLGIKIDALKDIERTTKAELFEKLKSVLRMWCKQERSEDKYCTALRKNRFFGTTYSMILAANDLLEDNQRIGIVSNANIEEKHLILMAKALEEYKQTVLKQSRISFLNKIVYEKFSEDTRKYIKPTDHINRYRVGKYVIIKDMKAQHTSNAMPIKCTDVNDYKIDVEFFDKQLKDLEGQITTSSEKKSGNTLQNLEDMYRKHCEECDYKLELSRKQRLIERLVDNRFDHESYSRSYSTHKAEAKKMLEILRDQKHIQNNFAEYMKDTVHQYRSPPTESELEMENKVYDKLIEGYQQMESTGRPIKRSDWRVVEL